MMPLTTSAPVLVVEESLISSLFDLQDPTTLYGLHSAVSKAKGITQDGERLSYGIWRYWTNSLKKRHTKHAIIPFATAEAHPASDELSAPPLSTSVESARSMDSFSSESLDNEEFTESSPPTIGMPLPCSEQVITSDTLQSLVENIKSNRELDGPLSPLPSPSNYQTASPSVSSTVTEGSQYAPTPRPTSPQQAAIESSASTIHSSRTDSSPTSASTSSPSTAGTSSSPSHKIVRGFDTTPAGISSYSSQPKLAQPTPILKTATNQKSSPGKKKKARLFEVGSGDSSESSAAMSPKSLSLRQSQKTPDRPSLHKKHTSFKEEVTEIRSKKSTTFNLKDERDEGGAIESDSEDEDSGAIEDDDEDDDSASDNALDDDDEGEWEDDPEPEDEVPDLPFQRIDSRPNLVSRRSMLAEGLHQSERQATLMRSAASAPRLHRSRTSTPNGPSMPGSPSEDSPIASRQAMQHHRPMPPVMNAKETRQNMLLTELNAELRAHMLNERKTRHHMPRIPEQMPGRAYQSSVDVTRLSPEALRSHENQRAFEETESNPYDDRSTDLNATGW